MTTDMLKRDFNRYESFYSADGMFWHDMYDETVEDTYTYEDENGAPVKVESLTVLGNVCKGEYGIQQEDAGGSIKLTKEEWKKYITQLIDKECEEVLHIINSDPLLQNITTPKQVKDNLWKQISEYEKK